jgi:hypothetical protein
MLALFGPANLIPSCARRRRDIWWVCDQREASKQVLLRAIGAGLGGPSLEQAVLLADPVTNVHRGAEIIATNNDWRTNESPAVITEQANRIDAAPLADMPTVRLCYSCDCRPACTPLWSLPGTTMPASCLLKCTTRTSQWHSPLQTIATKPAICQMQRTPVVRRSDDSGSNGLSVAIRTGKHFPHAHRGGRFSSTDDYI